MVTKTIITNYSAWSTNAPAIFVVSVGQTPYRTKPMGKRKNIDPIYLEIKRRE